MNPVNWTAILALLALGLMIANLAQLLVTSQALTTANDARAAVVYAGQRVAEEAEFRRRADLEAQRLATELDTEQRLHRNLLARQSRSASRKVQHQERGNAAD